MIARFMLHRTSAHRDEVDTYEDMAKELAAFVTDRGLDPDRDMVGMTAINLANPGQILVTVYVEYDRDELPDAMVNLIDGETAKYDLEVVTSEINFGLLFDHKRLAELHAEASVLTDIVEQVETADSIRQRVDDALVDECAATADLINHVQHCQSCAQNARVHLS